MQWEGRAQVTHLGMVFPDNHTEYNTAQENQLSLWPFFVVFLPVAEYCMTIKISPN